MAAVVESEELFRQVGQVFSDFFQSSLNWSGGDDQLYFKVDFSMVTGESWPLETNEEDTEILIIRRKDGQFSPNFMKQFRPTMVGVFNEILEAGNAWTIATNYNDSPIDRNLLYYKFDTMPLTWSPWIPRPSSLGVDWGDAPEGQQIGALALIRLSGENGLDVRWDFRTSYAESLKRYHNEKEIEEIIAKCLKEERGRVKLNEFFVIDDFVIEEEHADKWIPSIFDVPNWRTQVTVTKPHWRSGIDENYEEEFDYAVGGDFCFWPNKSYTFILETFGDILSSRIKKNIKLAMEWNDKFDRACRRVPGVSTASDVFAVAYILRGRDLHMVFEVINDKYIVRESYTLDEGHPFFEKHNTHLPNKSTFDSQIREWDREHGDEKRAIYDRVLMLKLGEGLDQDEANEEALEKAEQYDPEYDADSTDRSAMEEGDESSEDDFDYVDETLDHDYVVEIPPERSIELILQIYEKVNPEKIPHIMELLDGKYKGKEYELLEKVRIQYRY
jgi:hypothetical protein